jgi:quercetin dioxygenase-like cupin family protein
MTHTCPPYELIDYQAIDGTPCPCGVARRGLMNVESVPYSVHLTCISKDAKVHYHKRITETYFVLECESDACLELDGQRIPVRPHMAVVIHPGTRHRAVGQMKVMIVASPKFDAADEWFD